jgi:hypothetical protein
MPAMKPQSPAGPIERYIFVKLKASMRDLKIFKWWPVIGAAAFGVILSGCGGNSSDNSSVRVANATITHPSLDLITNGAVAVTGTALDTISAYTSPTSGATAIQLNDTSTGAALTTTTPTLSGSDHYTVLAYESGGTVKTAIINEDVAAPTSGTALLRFYTTALDAGKLDVYIIDPNTVLTPATSPSASFVQTTTPLSSGFLSVPVNSGLRIVVTGGGNQSDLRLDTGMTGIMMTNQEIATFALTPAAGGLLLNGSTIIQQGAYSAVRNINARVRLAAAVTGTSSVTLNAGTNLVGTGVAPAFSSYVLVPASSTLSITGPNGSIAAPSATMQEGNDYTVLVYGDIATATASLLTDDNRPPSDTTTVKLRFINGVTGVPPGSTMTFSANSAAVGTNIGAGSASGYVSVVGTVNATSFALISSAVGGTYYSNNNSFVLAPNTTYSVLVGGSYATPAQTELLIQ